MFRKHLPYDEETYALLISAYTRAGAKEKAMSTFADMQSKVYSPHFYCYEIIYLLIVTDGSCPILQGQVRISTKTIGALLVTCRESNDVEVRYQQTHVIVQRCLF